MKKSWISVLPLVWILMMVFVASVANAADQEESKKEKDKNPIKIKVVVTATKLETPADQVGSSISVVTGEQIEEMQKTSVADVLRTVPGLDVVQSGGPGGNVSVFIRGAKSEQTLVLIDGVEMNDPITSGRIYNLAHLSTDNIDRIEVLRGPQSTLYGSDAIGGVINIITRKGEGKASGFASLEGGSFNTYREAAEAGGGNSRINYSVGFSRLDTDGISSADAADGNVEADGYGNTSVYGKMGLTPTDNFDLDFTMRFIDAAGNIDDFAGAGGDDPNNTENTQQLFFRTQGRLYLFDDIWETKLGFSLANHDRTSRNDTDAEHPNDSSSSVYDGRMLKFDWQNNFYLHPSNTATFGIETENDSGSSEYYSESAYGPYSSVFAERSIRTTGYYLQDQIKLWKSWFTTAGVRFDDNSLFGTETTYRFASAYHIRNTGTQIRGSYGTGFKAPTLYQLYSEYGDLELLPEKSTGWDFGLEQSVYKNRASVGATIFHNEFDEMIDFDLNTWTFVNVARAVTKGLEVFASARAAENLDLRLSYTYTLAKDVNTGEALVRRPKNKLDFDLNYGFLEKGNVNFEILFVGARDDIYGAKLGGYALVNPAVSYRITRNMEMFARAENLFNYDYQEVTGYGTPGASVYGGIKFLLHGE